MQCKQWKALTVGVTVVRELYDVIAADGAAGGFVVTSGRFTDEAQTFAKGRNITLMAGPDLLKLIKRAQAGGASKSAAVEPEKVPAASTTNTAPLCPLCAKAMVKRVAERGGSSGGAFWGCSGFPGCRGTRQVE